MPVCLPPTRVAAGPLEQSSRPMQPMGHKFPPHLKWGSLLPEGWWQQRKYCSPGQWVRQAVWHCGSADLWDMKSPKWSHPTHVKPTDGLCMCASSPFGSTQSAGLMWDVGPVGFYQGFRLNSLSTNMNLTFLGRVHMLFHTPAGILVELLIIPVLSSGKMCLHQGCTSCGYFLFEVREVKLFAWYIPFIFLMVMGEHLLLAAGFPSLNLECCTNFPCICLACRALYSSFIL